MGRQTEIFSYRRQISAPVVSPEHQTPGQNFDRIHIS
jgi:hypothetical protein